MNHTGRILAVTAGLIVGGAIFGAIAAVATLMIGLAAIGRGGEVFDLIALEIVATVGAMLGGVLFPAAAWLLMRTVPIGLALLGTVAGTTAGGAAGWLVASNDFDQVVYALIGGVIGFAAASVLLRIRAGWRAERPRVSVG
jgi:hypothetical protein